MSKKKVTPKVSDPKAKYSIGGKIYFINYPGGKSEILEGQIDAIQSTRYPERDGVGKIRGYTTLFEYQLTTKRGDMLISEFNIFPSYQSVANEFAKSFLTLLK